MGFWQEYIAVLRKIGAYIHFVSSFGGTNERDHTLYEDIMSLHYTIQRFSFK